ncbi:protein RGF1 INDUCIBLE TRANSCRIPTION FACTOR 1-like [Andrographis paniculata]|uniref:protein RGF1 INDUCIBLE TRANSCRIPTION FACTOR 1-like n=1 Tax=Andrographis paniculata TaxID=175694 RepID=UPI0021E907DA|nr:protein RGF1 INDUCIBLE TRANSCRIPTION FACTOR 1-like [Andrographis paniculata]
MVICKHCVKNGHHNAHTILTVHRHLHQDVIPLSELETLIDCSKIKPYRSNNKWVISVNPLPHIGSSSVNENSGVCNVCKRRLNPKFRLCSLTCKVSEQRSLEQLENAGGTKHRRKGVPRRAPLF